MPHNPFIFLVSRGRIGTESMIPKTGSRHAGRATANRRRYAGSGASGWQAAIGNWFDRMKVAPRPRFQAGVRPPARQWPGSVLVADHLALGECADAARDHSPQAQ